MTSSIILTGHEIERLYQLIAETDDESKKREYQAIIDRSYDLQLDYCHNPRGY